MCYLFGSLQHFTKTLLTIVTTILYRRIMGQVDAGQVHSLPQPPQEMQTLHFLGMLSGAAIYATRSTHEPLEGSGTTATTSLAILSCAATASSSPTTTSPPMTSMTPWAT